MKIEEAERIIAEWLKVYRPVVVDGTHRIGAVPGRWEDWSPASDANLWFGADGLLFAVVQDVERFPLATRFIDQLHAEADRQGGPSSEWSCLFGGPLSWTLALAAAIKEIDGRTRYLRSMLGM